MATVFLNGSFVGDSDARVSVFDAGLQHGVGLFETMLAIVAPGESPTEEEAVARVRVLHMDEHLRRLAGSARELNLSQDLRLGPLGEAVVRTAARHAMNGADGAALRLRLTITGGELNMLRRDGGEKPQLPTVLVVAQPATRYPRAMLEQGVTATLADFRVNPLDAMSGHKTLNYWPRLRELQRAGARGGAEALVFQVTNHLAGGCVSNAFVVRDGEVFTPIARGEEAGVLTDHDDDAPARDHGGGGVPLPAPVLPGVTRQWAIDTLASRGLAVSRRMLSIDDVLRADEVFLTNSSWGVLPLVRVESEPIGGGAVGDLARSLVDAWALEIGGADPQK